ncbi:MAG: mRNA surveillance protein pelota [Candidatus Bathyarchaeia archaeon]
MKILEMNLRKGFVKVIPETFDDLWHLYNIIYKGDEVYAYTSREIKQDEKYARTKRSERVPVFLGVKVEKVLWDKLLGRLRVHGTICQAPETVPIGAHHTLNIVLNTPVTIVKEEWPRHYVERLEAAKKVSEKPVIIVAIDDECYVVATTTQYGVEVNVEERTRLPGKLEAEKRITALKEFFQKALESLRQTWSENHNPIAVIGVGFIKNDFVDFVRKEAPEIAKSIVDVKSVNNSGVAGIYEAIRSGVLAKTMRHLRIIEETEAIEEILKRLGKNEKTVAYGLKDVHKANDLGAVELLVLTDALLRESSDVERLSLEQLMKNVEAKGGKILVVSTEHEAGAKLTAIGGIAAMLRYALPANSLNAF